MEHEARIAELEAEQVAKDAQIAEQGVRLAEQAARIAEQDARIEALMRQVAELTEKLGRNSGNSNLPPSSDSPGERANRNKGKPGKGKRRGGQPGHRGSRRALLASEHVDDVVNLFPSHCEHCTQSLPETPDPHAKRYQFTELPAFEPHTTEFRRHKVRCPCCGKATRAAYDAQKIPSSAFGPRLMSAVALLTGVYHLSRRRAAELLSDLVGVRISLGAVSTVEQRVSEAVVPAVEEAHEHVLHAAVKHTDGTTWLQAGAMLSLWPIATACATVFKIVRNGRAESLRPFYGKLLGILVSDRTTALTFWAIHSRQMC